MILVVEGRQFTVQGTYGPRPHTTHWRVLYTCYCGAHREISLNESTRAELERGLAAVAEHVGEHIAASSINS